MYEKILIPGAILSIIVVLYLLCVKIKTMLEITGMKFLLVLVTTALSVFIIIAIFFVVLVIIEYWSKK